jgi:homogentisate 1,2-dioxygenase
MAFMFETRAVIHPTRQSIESAHRQRRYQDCWRDLRKHFVAPRGG